MAPCPDVGEEVVDLALGFPEIGLPSGKNFFPETMPGLHLPARVLGDLAESFSRRITTRVSKLRLVGGMQGKGERGLRADEAE